MTGCKRRCWANLHCCLLLLNREWLLHLRQVLEQAVKCNAGMLLSDETLCNSFKAAFMLGDPISKPKEYGDIMGYYSRQVSRLARRMSFGVVDC